MPFWQGRWSNITAVHGSMLSIIAGDILVLWRLFWQVKKARRRFHALAANIGTNENTLEVALISGGETEVEEEPLLQRSATTVSLEQPRRTLWTSKRSHLLLIPAYVASLLFGYSVLSIASASSNITFEQVLGRQDIYLDTAMEPGSGHTFGTFARIVYQLRAALGIFAGCLQGMFQLPQFVLVCERWADLLSPPPTLLLWHHWLASSSTLLRAICNGPRPTVGPQHRIVLLSLYRLSGHRLWPSDCSQ